MIHGGVRRRLFGFGRTCAYAKQERECCQLSNSSWHISRGQATLRQDKHFLHFFSHMPFFGQKARRIQQKYINTDLFRMPDIGILKCYWGVESGYPTVWLASHRV